MCRFSSLFEHFFPIQIDVFFHFLSRGVQQTAKNFTFVDFDWENASMAQVLRLYNKWFLKNQNFRQKFNILLILTGEKCIEMA